MAPAIASWTPEAYDQTSEQPPGKIMKRILILILLLVPALAAAQSRPLETTDEARQRHNAERYDTYRQRGNQAPLGGYQDRLGDPAPRGTDSPGMASPYSRDIRDSGSDRDRRGYR